MTFGSLNQALAFAKVGEGGNIQSSSAIFRRTPFMDVCADGNWERTGYFKYTLEKIPSTLLIKISKFFQKVTDRFDTEAMAEIWWDAEEQIYRILIPPQSVTRASVYYDRASIGTFEQQIYPKLIRVLVVHSHDSISCSFSGTDDEDEQEPYIYGVFYNYNRDTASKSSFRACAGGENGYVNLDYSCFVKNDLIEGEDTRYHDITPEALYEKWLSVTEIGGGYT